MRFLICSVFLLLLSCASGKPSGGKSTAVLQALISSGMIAVKNGESRLFQAEDVSCLRDLTKELWKCKFLSQGKSYEIPPRESAVLSEILFELPVAQGDSGAATSFIGCRTNDGDPESAQCDIAVPLDPVI